jgi:hypothetical protein
MGGTLEELTRRQFFTSGSKDVLKDILRSWSNFNEAVKKEANRLSCDEAAFKVFGKKSGKNFLKKVKSFSRKEGI